MRYRRKIRLKKIKIPRKRHQKLEVELKEINKHFPINKRKISKPKDLSNVIFSLKQNFNKHIKPYITGEYKIKKKPNKEVIRDTKKTISLRRHLVQLSTHLKDFIFQLKMYLISKTPDKEEYNNLKKEIKEWEQISEKIISNFIKNLTTIIQRYLVPACEDIEKNIKQENEAIWKRNI